MITKVDDGQRSWLFPESFQLLLDQQLPTGRWEQYASGADSIINTLASLLALTKHQRQPSIGGCPSIASELDLRICNARRELSQMLQLWDVKSTRNVAFEIIVPALLEYLGEESITFSFPGYDVLQTLRSAKLGGFDHKVLYKNEASSVLHSLEAFVGKLDFDRVTHHKVQGSMMASPSSTAAYLMNVTEWAYDAEEYLRNAVQTCQGDKPGGVPSAFPTSIFEMAWVLSTLLLAGYTGKSLGETNVSIIANFLEHALKKGNGVVGFAPGFVPDADDTAKAQLALSLLGHESRFATQLVARFACGTHFQTYPGERNPSVSANCNVLMALLHSPDPNPYRIPISNATKFVCDAWDQSADRDKWNLSDNYVYMLQGQAFVRLLACWDKGYLKQLPALLVQERVPLALIQILHRTLQSQHSDGSFGALSCESTAYAVLTLTSISSLPWFDALQPDITSAIESGQQFLANREMDWHGPSYLWIEKVVYSMPALCQAYCIAARYNHQSPGIWTESVRDLLPVASTKLIKLQRFFSSLPIFKTHPFRQRLLLLSQLEASLFAVRMRRARSVIFPSTEKAEQEYLDYIPFITTSCNYLGTPVSTELLSELMLLSLLNYQADEYMESVVGMRFGHELQGIRESIVRLCRRNTQPVNGGKRGREPDLNSLLEDEKALNNSAIDVELVFKRFIAYIINHTKVLESSESLRRQLESELRIFMLAHVQQIEDNKRRSYRQSDAVETTSDLGRTYFEWVRGTSADHTSCPYSFVFWACLISKSGQNCFANVKAMYLAQDLSRHLATMCRQYNDYGSVARDRTEGNLNSIDFEEFQTDCVPKGSPRASEDADVQKNEDDGPSTGAEETTRKKDRLLWIAEYERQCLELSLERLANECSKETMDAIQFFVRVTDLYGQIYVARDIGVRTH
ncbi:hypothetical protein XPA_003839 [Xanthoria parietina]